SARKASSSSCFKSEVCEPQPCTQYGMNQTESIPALHKDLCKSGNELRSLTVARLCAQDGANQSLPAASITVHATAKPCRSSPAATQTVHVPNVSQTDIAHLHPTTEL